VTALYIGNSYTGVEYILNTLQALRKEMTCTSEVIGRRISILDTLLLENGIRKEDGGAIEK
jgi:hypothetical protein